MGCGARSYKYKGLVDSYQHGMVQHLSNGLLTTCEINAMFSCFISSVYSDSFTAHHLCHVFSHISVYNKILFQKIGYKRKSFKLHSSMEYLLLFAISLQSIGI